jgi:integrase
MEPQARPDLATLQTQFLLERRYLKNLADRSIGWYRGVFRVYGAIEDNASTLPTKARLHRFVILLRERGVKPVTINSYRTALNALCGWLHAEGHLPDRVSMPHLRVARSIVPTFTEDQIKALLRPLGPRFTHQRLRMLVALLIDTGLRIEEALTLPLRGCPACSATRISRRRCGMCTSRRTTSSRPISA